MLKYWFSPKLMFLSTSFNPSRLHCFLFLERTVAELNEIIYLKVTITQKATFVIRNLGLELPIRDFGLILNICFLAWFPPLLLLLPFCFACFFLLVPFPLIYLLSCEKSNCSLICKILSRTWLKMRQKWKQTCCNVWYNSFLMSSSQPCLKKKSKKIWKPKG